MSEHSNECGHHKVKSHTQRKGNEWRAAQYGEELTANQRRRLRLKRNS